MKKLLVYFIVLLFSNSSFSQKNNGDVNSLINTESYLNDIFASTGINKTYQKFSKRNTIFYVPQPVNAIQHYKVNKTSNQVIYKTPDYAVLSKSASFGFTSGIITSQIEQNIIYARYLTIWKSSRDGKWSIELNAINPQPKPNLEDKPLFINPDDRDFPRIYGPPYIQLREKVIFNTDSLLGSELKKVGNRAIKNFYADDVRLFLPNQFPIIGKVNVLNKIEERNQLISSKPYSAKRASSGDIAYTTGIASVGNKSYDYIRIWQKDKEMKWNIIVDMFVNEKE
jgi:ketosteroid isomerase-like protein